MFVYKDFVVREIVTRIGEQLLAVRERAVLRLLEKDHAVWVERDMTTWAAVMMQIGVLESYQSIVTPNEVTTCDRKLYSFAQVVPSEGQNFRSLQKRYVRMFLPVLARAQNQLSFTNVKCGTESVSKIEGALAAHKRAMSLIDSDFDTEDDEEDQAERLNSIEGIEELISHPKICNFDLDSERSVPNSSSSDEAERRAVEDLPDFVRQSAAARARLTASNKDAKFLRNAREFREKKRKLLAQSIIDHNPFRLPAAAASNSPQLPNHYAASQS